MAVHDPISLIRPIRFFSGRLSLRDVRCCGHTSFLSLLRRGSRVPLRMRLLCLASLFSFRVTFSHTIFVFASPFRVPFSHESPVSIRFAPRVSRPVWHSPVPPSSFLRPHPHGLSPAFSSITVHFCSPAPPEMLFYKKNQPPLQRVRLKIK